MLVYYRDNFHSPYVPSSLNLLLTLQKDVQLYILNTFENLQEALNYNNRFSREIIDFNCL